MSGYFVTAIGTDIGKTYVGAQLLRTARAAGRTVSACKPLMSGFGEDALEASDAGQLLIAMGRPVTPETVSEICQHRFEPPLAPNVAMRRAGMAQDDDAILSFARASLPSDPDAFHLVEGAGGLMSPVTDQKLHSDFILDLGLPVILVAAGYLGAVSHTLTALDWLRSNRVPITALIVSQPQAEAEDPAHLIGEVSLWSDVPSVALPYGADGRDIWRAVTGD
nr:dethiobiotin synthase [Hyphomonas sp. Mor2]